MVDYRFEVALRFFFSSLIAKNGQKILLILKFFTDLIFDTKLAFTDFYQMIDNDASGELTLNELFNGVLKVMESFGINFKTEMKSNVNIMADIAKMSLYPGNDIKIPQCNIVKKIVILLSTKSYSS